MQRTPSSSGINTPELLTSAFIVLLTSAQPRAATRQTRITVAISLKPVVAICLGVCCLLVPAQGLAFNSGDLEKTFKNSADSVKQHFTDLKVEEGIDQTIEGQPAPTQQQVSGSNNPQPERQTIMESQQRLNVLGYNAVPADSKLGAKSVIAIKDFQQDHGLPETGQVSLKLLVAKSQQSSPAPGGSGFQPISIAGQRIHGGTSVEVVLPNGLDSTQLKVNDTVSAFWPTRTTESSTSGPAVILRIVQLSSPVSNGGFADVAVNLESIDDNGKRVAIPNTVARVVTDQKDMVKTEGNAAAKREVAAAREVDELFGTGQKDAVRIPAGGRLIFRVGMTESYISSQALSNHPSRIRPWFAPKSGPQK